MPCIKTAGSNGVTNEVTEYLALVGCTSNSSNGSEVEKPYAVAPTNKRCP